MSKQETRYVICAQPVEDHVDELIALGVGLSSTLITEGTLTSTESMTWIGVEPLPVGDSFMLRSWDTPVEREPGWHSFKRITAKANALSLAAFRVSSNTPRQES